MRTSILFLSWVALMVGPGLAGCRDKPATDEASRLGEGFSSLRDLLRTGPPTVIAAGPRDGAAFLEDGSRWAAEELARVLRLEGFADLVGSRTTPAAPLRDVEVVGPGSPEDLTRLAKDRGARVIVFVGLRAVELRESGPRLLDWTYQGAVAILDVERDLVADWEVTGSERKVAPNKVPEDPAAARRPLAEEWARGAFRKGALGTAGLPRGD